MLGFGGKIKEKKEDTGQLNYFNWDTKKVLLLALLAISVVMAGVVLLIIMNKPAPSGDNPPSIGEQPGGGQAPGMLGVDGSLPVNTGNGVLGASTSTNDIRAEYLTFGQFYKKEDIGSESNILKFDLPINIKADVSNYHYIYRKVGLDPYIDDLNSNGFAIINNPFASEADDFYSLYGLLADQGIPVLVTNDFLVYYYHNIIKQVFKDIEKDVFYKNIWNINKKFFDIANARYRSRFMKVGLTNDPVLEGERLEAIFFAVALELLKPTEGQVNYKVNFTDGAKFTSRDAEEFYYALPDYLSDDVKKEVNLIRSAAAEAKSPTFLYARDYKTFKVPQEYSTNAKLNNFYLATKWMNTIFPLYYQDNACENCLADKDDWLINMVAASFIAKDLSASQEFKNQWAKIYKIISFFSGLRSDLTYLHYNKTLSNLFGDEYEVEEIFSNDNSDRDNNISKIQEKMAEYSFAGIEGGYDRADAAVKPIIGLRMLAESYWPNDYIFSRLINPLVSSYLGDKIIGEFNSTACGKGRIRNRCRGVGLDVINLIYPTLPQSEYLIENTNYQGYDEQIKILREQLDNFNVDSWHNNSYWATLDILKSMLETNADTPAFAQKSSWEERNINTALGSWVNLQLPANKFELKPLDTSAGIGSSPECNAYNYVEPNLELVSELRANGQMLLGMLDALGITMEVSSVSNYLEELDLNLRGVERIIKKELSDETLNIEDCEFIDSMVNQYIVEESGSKDILISLKNTGERMKEGVDGVKLIIAVNKRGEEKIFIFGPIFNYKEK